VSACKGLTVLRVLTNLFLSLSCRFAMLGLDEISHLLEQPFRLMPLYQLSKNSMTDVGDALVCQPPGLYETTAPTAEAQTTQQPPYWV
jgi:hypothetical protein